MQSECQLWEFCCKTLEIITHSLKNSLCTHGCAVFLLPCDQRNPLFPHHVLGHYYLITELSNSPSVRPECFASTHTSQQWRQKKKKSLVSAIGDLFCMTLGVKKKKVKLNWNGWRVPAITGYTHTNTHSYTWTLSLSLPLSHTHTHTQRKLWWPRIGHIANTAMF